jgi:ectoine hydroxylase-related dioxygenase (phytanoyl-CoA dioxygenase family)
VVPVRDLLQDKGVDVDALGVYRAEHFPEHGPRAWLDEPEAAAQIEAQLAAGRISAEQADKARQFRRDGYVVFETLIDEATVDRAWTGFLRDIERGRVPLDPEPTEGDNSGWGRVPNVHAYVPEMRALLEDARIMAWMAFLLGRPVHPFQTIPSFYGSQQLGHTDAIHMTTYPLGFLAAAWIALEDIHADSGPLAFYPGSHRLPYYLSRDVGIQPHEYKQLGRDPYLTKYEPFIQDVIKEQGLEPSYFVAKKGDVLVWHHNLIHAGSTRRDRTHTRKSLVCHYYATNVVAYHDLSGDLVGIF